MDGIKVRELNRLAILLPLGLKPMHTFFSMSSSYFKIDLALK